MREEVTREEQLFADLDTAAIALRLMGTEHPRLKLERIAARVSAHAREVLSGAVRISPRWGETIAQRSVGGESGAEEGADRRGCTSEVPSSPDLPPTVAAQPAPPAAGSSE